MQLYAGKRGFALATTCNAVDGVLQIVLSERALVFADQSCQKNFESKRVLVKRLKEFRFFTSISVNDLKSTNT